MKIPSLLLLALLSTLQLHAQPYWELLASGIRGSITGITKIYDGTLFISSYGAGVFRSVDGGRTWAEVGIAPDEALSVVSTIDGVVFAGLAASDNVYRSTNEGITWAPVGSGTAQSYALKIGPGNTLYSGTSTGVVFISTDYGDNWHSATVSANTGIFRLGVSPLGTIFASNAAQTFRSIDSGTTWENLVDPFEASQVLNISTGASGAIYISAYKAEGGRLFISTDDGETWVARQFPQSDTRVRGTIELPNGDLIVVADNAGIWRSTDAGQSWFEYWEGTIHGEFNSIVQAHDGSVYACADDAVYKLIDNTSTAPQVVQPQDAALSPAYPNPFSGSTTITYSLPAQQHISLDVYNTLGRKVQSLYNGLREPGEHNARLHASALPAGMYRVVLRSAEGVQTQMVVVR